MRAHDPVRVFGRRLAELRLARGFTQAELAERTEIAALYLSRIEQGLHNVGVRMIHRLARSLSIEPCELLKRPGSMAVYRGRPPTKKLRS